MHKRNRKYLKLHEWEILELLLKKIVRVDPLTGEIFSRGIKLKFYLGGRCKNRKFVKIVHENKRKTISVCKLVWISQTLTLVPKDFEIHHFDKNSMNDSFQNLFCLHRLDHLKYHVAEEKVSLIDEIPF